MRTGLITVFWHLEIMSCLCNIPINIIQQCINRYINSQYCARRDTCFQPSSLHVHVSQLKYANQRHIVKVWRIMTRLCTWNKYTWEYIEEKIKIVEVVLLESRIHWGTLNWNKDHKSMMYENIKSKARHSSGYFYLHAM